MTEVDDNEAEEKMATGPVKRRTCQTCKQTGTSKEARRYCEDCQTYMCHMCCLAHRRSTVTRDHRVTTGLEETLTSQATQVRSSLGYCEHHKDRVIEWYCVDHDDLICKTCLTMTHKQCEFKHMSQMPETPRYDKRIADIIRSLFSVRSRILNLETTRKQNTYELKKLRSFCQAEVKAFRKKIDDLMDKLEKEMLGDIYSVIAEEEKTATGHMNICSTLIAQVDADTRIANEAKTVDDNTVNTISSHKLSKRLKEAEIVVADMEREAHNVKIEFQPDRTLVNMLNIVEYLGTMNIEFPGSKSQAFCGSPGLITKSLAERTVDATKALDGVMGGITGSTFMPDDQLVLTDNTRNLIMLLDRKMEVKSKLQLPVKPWVVAANSAKDVIVTVPSTKTLQYVDIYPRLRAVKTLKTDKPCWGVDVHNGEIYVSMHNNPGQGEIQVLDKRGKIKRKFGLDVYNKCILTSPNYLTVSARGCVYISDRRGRVICYSELGEIIYDIRITNVKLPCGMIVDKEDNLFVCCEDANAVQIFRKNGAFHRILLAAKDRVCSPRSLSYRNTDNTLIVTMFKGRSRAYTLK